MNSTMSDWDAKLSNSFDLLHPNDLPLFSNTSTRDILVIIGLIAICFLLLILIIQCLMKVRQIYRTSEPNDRLKKSCPHQGRYPSYQKLLDLENNQCKCFQYSCLPKLQCVKPNCRILTRHSYYEQIDERRRNNSTCPSNISCIRVHITK